MISCMAHVTTGCRDCKKCTNSGVANLGRNSGRAGAAVLTLGLSEAVMTATKNCRICGHKLSLHSGVDEVLAAQDRRADRAASKNPPAGWFPETTSGRARWWDGMAWGPYKEDWDREQATALAATAPAAPAGVAAELQRLGEMHSAGLLTEAEFAAAKTSVLGL